MEPRVARFAGSLVGQALGDALGFVVEGQGAAACAAHVRAVLRPPRSAGWARAPHATGQYSDDTQLARELAASLVERGGFEPADYARRIAAIFAERRIVGHGPSTEAAAQRLALGVPWHAAGMPGPVAGNGGAMRVAPLALVYADDTPRLHAMAHAQARITHADPRCGAGAVAVAGAVVAALQGRLHDAPAICAPLAAAVQRDDPVLAQALRTLPAWLVADPADAAVAIAATGVDGADGRFGIAPHVTPSVLWALYAALRHPGDYVEAIATAIEPGGDVDTTAAMAGAIVGAAVGLQGLPHALAVTVHDRGGAGFDALCGLARELAALAPGRP